MGKGSTSGGGLCAAVDEAQEDDEEDGDKDGLRVTLAVALGGRSVSQRRLAISRTAGRLDCDGACGVCKLCVLWVFSILETESMVVNSRRNKEKVKG